MKRQIPYWLQEKWQNFANAIADLFNIPAAVIMKLDEKELEVYLASDTKDNPFVPGSHRDLSGSYCEAVISSQQIVEIPDASNDPLWIHNAQLNNGLLNYLGFPLNYPDGIPFGSLCVLDKKRRIYTEVEKTILRIFREMIEQDIALVYYYNDKQADLIDTIHRQHDTCRDKGKNEPVLLPLHTSSSTSESHISICYFSELIDVVTTSLEAILSLSRVIQKDHVTTEDICTYARGIERKSTRLLERISSIQKAALNKKNKMDDLYHL